MQSGPTSSFASNDTGLGGELDRLYRSYRESVRRYILRTFGSGPPDPEDVVQAAFEKYVGLENRSEISNPRAFLIASARNYVLDQHRRSQVRNEHAANERALADEADDFDAERVLSARERWRILERAIRDMEPRRQEILIMHRIHGLSSAEIARRKGCSATLVKTLLAQALVLCERALREVDGE